MAKPLPDVAGRLDDYAALARVSAEISLAVDALARAEQAVEVIPAFAPSASRVFESLIRAQRDAKRALRRVEAAKAQQGESLTKELAKKETPR